MTPEWELAMTVHRWVYARARKIAATNGWGEEDIDDLASEGMLGAHEAATRYDRSRGSFTTYSTYWIHRHQQRWLVGRLFAAKAPINVFCDPQFAAAKNGLRPASLDQPLAGQTEPRKNLLRDAAPSAEDALCAAAQRREAARRVAALSPRHRYVIEQQIAGVPDDEVARTFPKEFRKKKGEGGVSRQWILNLRAEAKKRLRAGG